jgi:major vault protein
LLQAHEELWEKELPELVEQLLAEQKVGQAYLPASTDSAGNWVYEKRVVKNYKRDKTRAINYRAPHNCAVQVYDFKLNTGRVVFGPSLLILGPYEEFTVINLSGGRPKKEGLIKTLALQLGPDFMTDLVNVETSDHARLQIVLSYNWYFKYDKANQIECQKMFQVPDFVGDVCKSIASRIRGAVSSVTFTDFHKKRKDLIQNAVFGTTSDGSSKPEFFLPANNLCITSVDVQNPEPIDPKMKESLFKAQTLNIEITTRTSELNAHHQALILEQESAGRLEIQRFNDQAEAEGSKKELLVLKAENEVIKAKGKAVAVAHAQAEAELIHVEAEVNQARLKAEALRIESSAEAEARIQNNKAEVDHKKAVYDLEIKKSNDLAEIEVRKFKEVVGAIGKNTIVAMARAGPETQAKMLKGLGLKGFLISDGKNPINLFNTANGILGSLNQNK